jgi:ATP-dependent exoDNAse (exonuclease V) beta subunit
LLKEVRTNLFYLTMMAHVHRYMEEYRKDNNALLLSDTNAIVHSIIAGDDTPFIYERLGLQLDHYLIDEFQDTSRMQWQNLLPLVRAVKKQGLAGNRR